MWVVVHFSDYLKRDLISFYVNIVIHSNLLVIMINDVFQENSGIEINKSNMEKDLVVLKVDNINVLLENIKVTVDLNVDIKNI